MKEDLSPQLPQVVDTTLPSVDKILSSFSLPREIIASSEEIKYAWAELPREIKRIPVELRDGLIARMCVAVSVGLFDGAINYIWNAVILNLRTRIKNFGLSYVGQILNKTFEEEDLNDLNDYNLLDLSFKLEILSEVDFFFLNQCRDIRNNFSSAHPSIAQIDDRELITFISRCCKHGISIDYQLKGINIAEFIDAIKDRRFNENTINIWIEQLENTFNAQRILLIPMLHGLYCDSSTKEDTRLNALDICLGIKELLDTKIKSSFIEQHNQYLSKSDESRIKASRMFFQKLSLVNLLSDVEKHSIVKNACASLFAVHQGYDNFYNEPTFARNLCDITNSINVIPESAKEEFVETVITCYVGNKYGVSHAAIVYYEKIIKNFKPSEIGYLLEILNTKTIVADRIKAFHSCKNNYLRALELIDKNNLSTQQKSKYDKINKEYK